MSDTVNTFDVEAYLSMELLRFTTAGSVDDGKSTLIGRLLYDSKAIFQDQMESLEQTSKLRGEEGVNLALLTDGLRAEREQGITIDVAYRYFSTPKRKFIIADTPGHVQYTRNMVTGASTADLAIVLIDARNGILTQSKRHGMIASLLGIPHVIVAVNKMDLVDYDQKVYQQIVQEYTIFSEKLNIHDITFIPVSALAGDNIVEKSQKMPWYDGPTILHQLESVTISADHNFLDFRFPVQYVVRPHQDFRGFAGRISSGTIRKGEEVMILPSQKTSIVKEVIHPDGNEDEAYPGQSVILTLEDEIDISRGDMIVRKNNLPEIESKFESMLCWMDDVENLKISTPYLLRHSTREVKAFIRKIQYRVNMDTLHRENADSLLLNEIGRVTIETAQPIFFDAYQNNRETGNFILVDPHSNQTVAAGMIRGVTQKDKIGFTIPKAKNVFWQDSIIGREERERQNGHKAHVLWFTGLSGAGKSTVAREVEKAVFQDKKRVYLLDGDNIRSGLNSDLTFSKADRQENIRRIGHVSRLMYDMGTIVLCAFISPNMEMREYVRSLFPEGSFSEVFIDCDVDVCRQRDVKGLYKKADAGEILNFTGVSAPYEKPDNPELRLNTADETVNESVEKVLTYINERI